jgi:hypothetical protein
LIVFLSQMKPAIDEPAGEVVRLKFWLENEQREFWENQLRRRQRRLEEAQKELFNARLASVPESSSLQYLAVQQAQRAVQEAEHKLGLLKKWARELEDLTSPLLKQIGQLQGFVVNDMAKAVQFLTQSIQTLAAYAESGAPSAAPSPVDNPEAGT